MPDGANKGAFVQGYNAQIAVDETNQIIVAALITQSSNDVRQLVPVVQEIKANVGELATTTSADAGYFSADNVEHPALENTNLLSPPQRQRHGATPTLEALPDNATPAQRMRHKLSQPEGRAAS